MSASAPICEMSVLILATICAVVDVSAGRTVELIDQRSQSALIHLRELG